MEPESAQRPHSLRSVASNSTIASATSLSRRPRTRKRSRTVTGASGRPSEPPLDSLPVQSDLPYLSGSTAQESSQPLAVEDNTTSELPSRPPKSPLRLLQVELTRSSDGTSSNAGVDATVVSEPLPTNTSTPVKHKAKPMKASSLPHLHIGYRPQPSAFSRDPALTPVVNVRDSVSTHQSGTSSSLYPPSTATISRADSPPTPPLISHDFESVHQSAPMNPEVPEVREYDSDDVAYRLRLLVNNNYFLPPAHAKPSPADFAPSSDTSKKSNKSPSPTFFDRFRVGKSKSKPSTPTGFDHTAPMLRTTSDSITSNHSPRIQQSKPPGQMPHTVNLPGGPPRGRVVVVREKVEDIMVAAKQAEQDLKAKSAARMDQESQDGNDGVDNAIDPTDAVDIPLPSPNYPFAVQASALHGLGVQDSVGADVLADRLPPPSHSYDPAEDRWRKALLQEAVHHSLDNTANSSFSNVGEVSTPKGSFRKKSLESDSPLSVAQILQQKIIDQPAIDIIESTPLTEKRPKSASTQRSKIDPDSSLLTVNTTSQASRPGSFLPLRAETPSGPMTSLGPAPRRIFANTHASLSQSDLTHHEQQRSLRSVTGSGRVLRRSHSSPHLAEGYDSSVSRLDAMSPPLPETLRDSQATTISAGIIRTSYHTIIASPTEWERQDSFLEMAPPRASFTTTRSEYSQASASPTLSTFQEVVNQPHQSGSDSHHTGPSRLSSDQHHASRGSPSLRYSAMSPPPRMSSSLAHVALPPPPRGSSLAQSTFRSQIPMFSDSSDSIRTGPAISSLEATTLQIVAPEPTTPPLPKENRAHDRHIFRHRRSQSSRAAVPSASTNLSISVQPTPGPSSPTSFFDTLQSQPNAMDDLESSSDEENEQPIITSSPKPLADLRSRATSNASPPRALIMRHGNFSTPYIRSGGSSTHLPVGHRVISKKPIENVPLRPSKYELPSSSYDFFNYAQDHPVLIGTGLHRSATADDSRNLVKPETLAQESLKKLDGMLMRHMEDERDTIKRIAHNLKQTAQS